MATQKWWFTKSIVRLRLHLRILRITDPCVSSKPFMRGIAVWTEGLSEKYRAGAKSSGINVCAGGNCPPGSQATGHKNTHKTRSSLWLGRAIAQMGRNTKACYQLSSSFRHGESDGRHCVVTEMLLGAAIAGLRWMGR